MMFYLGKMKFLFIFLLLIMIKNADATTQHCHAGTGRCFWMGNGTLTWEDARAACQQDGGDLAVMETAELFDYVKDEFT